MTQLSRWARYRFTPNLPLYSHVEADGTVTYERVTASREHIALAREAATEGMVLLKNTGNILPIARGSRVALFGKGTFDYVKGGGGSGDVYCPYVHNLYDAFKVYEAAGELVIDEHVAGFYRDYVQSQYAGGKERTIKTGAAAPSGRTAVRPGMIREAEVPAELVQHSAAVNDVAIISISRFSGEAWDRKSEFGEAERLIGDDWDTIDLENEIFDKSDYYLMPEEAALVEQVTAAYERVVIVLNVGGMVDVSWIAENDRIQGALLSWQGGMEGGTAAADLLLGHANPSGHLSDTFARRLEDYPSTAGFHESSTYVDYTEDIYVGYRYFETLPAGRDAVIYPFGYGLSYTTFTLTNIEAHTASAAEIVALHSVPSSSADPSVQARACGLADAGAALTPALGKTGPAADPDNGTGDVILARVTVTNTGAMAGKEVVQLYVSAPQGQLSQPARRLVAYAKTRLLQPGDAQILTLAVNADDLASYDDLGRICKSSYVLEAGDYAFYLGTNVRDAAAVDYVYTVAADTVTQRLTSKLAPRELSCRLRADGTYENLPQQEPLDRDESVFEPMEREYMDGTRPEVRYQPHVAPKWEALHHPTQLLDVAEGKATMEEFLAQLSDEDLAYLVSGTPNTGVANTYGYGNQPQYGIPNVMTADGPAGLRFLPQTGVRTTAFPCATLLACTWNPEIVYRVGAAGGEEARENNIGAWLTPAVNIHRSPLCGRNFEYYSEDPYLAGVQAAAMVAGIQSVGIAATVKHFALNNKESNRRNCDSRASERAIREIYLRQFEIIVKRSHPWSFMTGYNIVNGERASTSKSLLNGILRGEWGFDGLVTTDWWNYAEQYLEIAAGNDIKMGCGYPDRVLAALEKGVLNRAQLELAARHVLELILRLE